MRIVFQRLYPFFMLSLVLIPFLFVSKVAILSEINASRTVFWDAFFIRSSAFGNAITVIFAFFLLFRFRLKWMAVFLLAFSIQVLVVLLFKQGLLNGELRPYLYFYRSGLMDGINLIDGVKIRYVNTFPSGHTATIFFLISFFALLARNKGASWVLLSIGIIVGFSRMYLFQHWFSDVYFGMVFGMGATILAYLFVRAFPKAWHTKKLHFNLRGLAKGTQSVLRQLF